MNFGSFLSWWHWLILGLIPPAIIALYFLKLKRQPLEVPSTYLWKKSIEDLHVNSFWQRMRQSLLLFLQLCFVGLLAFALARPYWETTQLQGNRFIFMIDNSASMRATDVQPGSSRTRLDEAKRRVEEVIDRLKSGDAAMLVSFSDIGRVEQQYTESKSDLRRALYAIPQTNRSTTLVEALHIADGLANPRRTGDRGAGDIPVAEPLPAELYIVSDGKFPDVTNFALGNLTPTFVPIGDPNVENLGITAFSVRRNEQKLDRLQAFFQIENFGTHAVTATLELYLDQDPIVLDSKQITVPPGQPMGDVFDLADLASGTLRLKLAHDDLFPVDNQAFAVVGANRRARVLLATPGNEALEVALTRDGVKRQAEITVVKPAYLTTDEYQKNALSGAYDLVIYDRCSPKESPQANTLYVGSLPPVGWTAEAKVSVPVIIDSDHTQPLMQAVELGDVLLFEATPLKPPAGFTRLIDSNKGTLFAIAPREGFEDAVLGLEFYGTDKDGARYANTNWTVKLSFPVFVLNAVNYLGNRGEAKNAGAYRPGQPVELAGDGAGERIAIRNPAGRTFEVLRGKQGRFHFTQTEETGIYEVGPADKVSERFAVSLFDPAESDIRPREKGEIKIGHESIQGNSAWEPARAEGWRWLALAALVLLIFEWYIYNRRVYL